MFNILLLLCVVPFIRACTGGTGQPVPTGPKSKSAVYSFDVAPAITWTWNNGPIAPGQASSYAAAKANAENDVKAAVYQAIPIIGSLFITYQSTYEPLEALIVSSCLVPQDGTYTVTQGTVAVECSTSGPRPVHVQGTITVESNIAYYESQWTTASSLVQQILAAKNVKFNP